MEKGAGDDADDGAVALLERARTLCAAANLIVATALPPLVPLTRVPSQMGSQGRENDVERGAGASQRVNGRSAPQKLPLLPSTGAMKSTRLATTKAPAEQTEAQRKQREAEKIRQARERAQARIARSNQQEQQQAQQQVEQQRLAMIEAAEKYAEKMRLAEEGRVRAQERVRMKRLTSQSNQERETTAFPQPVTKTQTLSASLVVPKRVRKTRPASTPNAEVQTGSVDEQAEPQEAPSETEEERKMRERRIRLETARRLRRAQQIAEEENRRRADAIQRELEAYRNRQRELDRIAKGLGRQEGVTAPQSSQESLNRTESETLHSIDVQENANVMERPPGEQLQLKDHSPNEHTSEQEPSPGQLDRSIESLTISLNDDAGKQSGNEQCESRSKSRRTPPWKRPPVPLLPTECYATKAIILPCSRTVVTADSYTKKHKLKRLNHSPSAPKCCLGS